MTPINAGKGCNDNNACTGGDACTAGQCTGAPVSCDDKNPCSDDACDPKAGCKSAFNTAPCNDGNACTVQDKCNAGGCFGTQLTCNDNNPCTDDSCNALSGCKADNNTAPCSDGNACTAPDQCAGGKCSGSGQVKCDDANPCTADGCETATGCKFGPGNEGAPCSDGSACTTVDACKLGKCSGSVAPACDDKNPCTSTACDPGKGCLYTAQGGSCDDGDPCTGDATAPDFCGAGTGVCKGGAPKVCDDKNACTTDSCGPTGCVLANNMNPCDDGQLCTVNDKCAGGKCSGTAGVPDQDGDGTGAKACGGTDCDDGNKLASPGLKETCTTAFDDNCNGVINEVDSVGCTKYGLDNDGDGYPATNAAGNLDTQCSCGMVVGSKYTADITKAIDCNDGNGAIKPGAKEDCKTPDDDNCAGGTNDVGALNCTVYFADGDTDGWYANGAAYQCLCAATSSFSATKSGDCDDTSKAINPGAKEDCETVGDDNCNGTTTEKDATNCTQWLFDADHDGHAAGTGAPTQCACAPMGDYSASPQFTGDCNDNSFGISPSAPEVCDGVDNSCNQTIDEGCDSDSDGFCDLNNWVTYGALCAKSTRPGAQATTLGRLLVLTADTTGVPESLRKALQVHNVHEGVDQRPVGGVTPIPVMPTAFDLRRYGAVVLLVDPAGSGIANPDALGDVLAEYVEGGGGLVIFHAAGSAKFVPGGKFANKGMKPFQSEGTWKAAAAPALSTGANYPQTHPLNLAQTFGTGQMLPPSVAFGTFGYATGVAVGGTFATRTWVNESGAAAVPFAVDSDAKWLGRVVGLNFRPGTGNQYLDQFARNAAHYVQRAWGDDCDDVNSNFAPGSPYEIGGACDGYDQDCDGFDDCNKCSAAAPIESASGWQMVETTEGPSNTVPTSGAGQAIDATTPWKLASWANAPGSTGAGIAFGPVDLPPPSQVPPGYPNTGTAWQVARYTFTAQDFVKRFEFRYRYAHDAFETGQTFDVFAVRLDQPYHTVLDLAPGTPVGGWKTKSYGFANPLQSGSHTIYLFFKTNDGVYNNGLGAAFDQFRVCNP